MEGFIKVDGAFFKAYIPDDATIFIDYQDGQAIKITVTDFQNVNYCLVNGIKYYGSTDIYLNENSQTGSIHQICEVKEVIDGTFTVGQTIDISHHTTITDGDFNFKPLNLNNIREEYIMRVVPDYTELLTDFFEDCPEIDPRIRAFLEQHPYYLDPVVNGMVHTNQKNWAQASIILNDGDDIDFIRTSIAGIIRNDIADSLFNFIDENYPQ